jgi:hypothetical protein
LYKSSSRALSFCNCLQFVTNLISKDDEETSVRLLELWLSSGQEGKATGCLAFPLQREQGYRDELDAHREIKNSSTQSMAIKMLQRCAQLLRHHVPISSHTEALPAGRPSPDSSRLYSPHAQNQWGNPATSTYIHALSDYRNCKSVKSCLIHIVH